MTFIYTYADSQVYAPSSDVYGKKLADIKLNGPAPNSFNTKLFYADKDISVRLAYSWREERLYKRITTNNFSKWDAPRRNLNLSTSYRFDKNFKLAFDVKNLTNAVRTKYQDNNPSLVFQKQYWGRMYSLRLNYTM